MLATYYALQNADTFQNIFSLSGSLPKKILEEIDSYPISRISLPFLNPDKRAGVLEKKYLIQITN